MLIQLLFLLTTLSFAGTSSEVRTVESVNLSEYMGKWYEIASIPQSFQKKCVSSVTAEYELLKNGKVKVLNSCQTESGKVKTAEARARVKDSTTNSKLEVTFVKIFDWVFSFGGNYWIIALAPDYSYAVVGDPTREYAWILARRPAISSADLEASINALKDNGYDTCKLLTTIQNDGFSERKPLCEVASK